MMFRIARRSQLLFVLLSLVFVVFLLNDSRHSTPPVYAGTGPTVTVPASNTEPTLDGICSSSDYSDANQVSITVAPASSTFIVYLKHTTNYFYACFNNPPLPAGGASFVSVYVDRDNDGDGSDTDDFVVSMPYAPSGSASAAYWNPATNTYNGPDPGGWSAQKYQSGGEFPSWNVEFRISRQTMGGWKRTVGLALFYHWFRFTGDDYAWPANNVWNNPQLWGNARLATGNITVGQSTTVPTLDGQCLSNTEYADANKSVTFSGGAFGTVYVYVKHTATDLWVCMDSLTTPSAGTSDGPNAAVYINRVGAGGETTGPDDMVFSISWQGTVRANRGSGAAFNGPDPGGYSVMRRVVGGEFPYWSAEFRISLTTLGGGWNRDICIMFAEQWVSYVGNDYGWPNAFRWNIPSTWGVATLTTSPSGSTVDLRPTNIEVTQAIQDLNNGVVLVANKRTFARVHVATNANRNGVQARLYGFRGGSSLGFPLLPSNAGGVINMVTTPNRGNLNDSFYFELPYSWTAAGTITLRAVINPFNDIDESNYTNNTLNSGNITFQSTKTLRIRIVDFQYRTGGGTLVASRTVDLALLESQLRRMYPISYLSSVRRSFFDGSISSVPTAGYVNACLLWSRNTYEAGDPGVLWYGMVSDTGGFMRGNSGSIPSWNVSGPTGVPSGSFAWDTDASYGDWYGAHEIGHGLGRTHANFCGAAGGGAYPYPNGTIGGPSGNTTKYYGFDAGDAAQSIAKRVIPNTWTDVMTYCSNEWVSDFTYTGIRNYIQSNFSVSQREAGSGPYVTGDFLSVYGTIDVAAQVASLSFLSRQSSVGEIPPLVPGRYRIRLFNASNVMLAEHPFTPLADTDGDGPSIIQQVVNFVAGTRRIAIYSDVAGREIGSANVSANAPTVSITSRTPSGNLPASGPVTLNWTGTDADGDRLEYTLLYSNDNRTTWRTLATMLTGSSHTFDASQLEGTGGASTGWFRVVANDGVLTGFGDNGPFAVAGKAPVATISSPVNGSAYAYGQVVALEGAGQDFEDGTLDDAHLSWSSDRDGDLGTGRLIHPQLLSVGTHHITETATDSNGQTGTAMVTITIDAAPAIPGPTLSAGPSAMLFLGTLGGPLPDPQTLSIRNLGSGSINWTASSDASWVTLSDMSGSAPADIMVTVNAKAVAAGGMAHITVTASGAADSPQVITVVSQMTDARPPIFLPVIIR